MKRWIGLLLVTALAMCGVNMAAAEDIAVVEDAADEVLQGEPDLSGDLVPLEAVELAPPEGTEGSAESDIELQGDAMILGNEAQDAQSADPARPAEPEEESEEPSAPALTLSEKKLIIGIGEECTVLRAVVTPSEADQTVTWKSANKAVASVDAGTGVILGKKKGTTTITAKSADGLEQQCKVIVRKAPDKVTVTATARAMSVGESFTLKGKLPSGTGSILTFTSSKKSVATVEKYTGKIRAIAPGKATITAETFNGKKARCKVTVYAEPDQVILPEAVTIGEKEKYTLTPEILDSDGGKTTASCTFSVDKGSGKVKIDAETGVLTGVAAGTVLVRVVTHNGVSTHLEGGKRVETVCVVTVVEGPEAVSLAASKITVGLKQSYALNPVILAKDGSEMTGIGFSVSSSDSRKVSVTSKGVIKAKAKGSATVTVKAPNGVKATCRVKVVNAPSKVTLSPGKSTLGVGETVLLKAKLPGGSAASFTYTSSNKKVAVVDSEGHVIGKKAGSAVITVRTHNGKKDKADVTVVDGPDFLSLNGEYTLEYEALTDSYRVIYAKTLEVGKTFTIQCENEYQTRGSVVDYSSSDESVATVSAKGVVKAREPGTADITVRATNGTEAVMRITVPGELPARIGFIATEVTVYEGLSTAAPGLKGIHIDAGELSDAQYKSGDKKIFKVTKNKEDGRWMLTGVKAGTAKLTATAGGATAVLNVTVLPVEKAGAIAFEQRRVHMQAGETCSPVVTDEYVRTVSVTLTSCDESVVAVDGSKSLIAVSAGTAKVTAVYDGLTAKMSVVVHAQEVPLSLTMDRVELGVGQRYAIEVSADGDGQAAGLVFSSDTPQVASVSSKGVVLARKKGTAVISVESSGGAGLTCEVTVFPAPSAIVLEPASIVKQLKAGGAQIKWRFGAADELGTVSFSSSDQRVATVDGDGYVTFCGTGMAVITAVTTNGLTAKASVTVLPDKQVTDKTKYRLFAAYSYWDSLPFTKRNASGMAAVFGKSDIDGQKYAVKVMGNPGKTRLLSGISGFFADADANDVSIVYLCSHGHNDKASYTDYRLSLPGYDDNPGNANYSITAGELFNCLERIDGNVVLILDSCYSGTFLEDMGSALRRAGGRIAVLTAASNTRATYYNVKKKSVDFFTFFMLQGLGYDEKNGWWNGDSKGSKGAYPGYLAADRAGNRDGVVTLGELYDYADRCIDANIPSYMKKSWYWGDKTIAQKTRFYAGSLEDLPVYCPGVG
ncbi:MAG: Ig-like domain-containing protein [Clostridia bacterium]|nr:Ig-like domain-containing protein [Clostridia bacterium]